MTATATPLIHMQGISKVFTTDEMETHALQSIDFEIRPLSWPAV